MWFVWDGHTRQGPYSEQEICRRLTMGQWSLSVFVRPQDRSIYRPLLWMLPTWCEVSAPESNETGRAFDNILNEATMIAPLEAFEGGIVPAPAAPLVSPGALTPPGQKNLTEAPDAAENRKEETQEKTPAELLSNFRKKKRKEDFLDFLSEDSSAAPVQEKKKESAAESVFSVLPQTDPPIPPAGVFAAPKERSRKAIDDVQLSPSFNPKSDVPLSEPEPTRSIPPVKKQVELDYRREFGGETKHLSIRQTRRVRLMNQKPKMVSEGLVNLVDNSSATQIRHRRVNPTAPRRRPRGFSSQIPQVLKYLPKKLRPGNSSFIWVVVAASVLVTFSIVSLLFYFFGRKGSHVVSQPAAAPQQVQSEGEPPKRRRKPKSDVPAVPGETRAFDPSSQSEISPGGQTTKKDKPKKEMAARSEPPDLVQRQLKKTQPKPNFDVLRNADEINNYLTNTSPGNRRFVVVGPLTLVEPPAPQCSPCQGKARLPDGTLVTLSSVIPEPWNGVNLRKKVYARGMVLKTSSYLITVNKISSKIPR